MSQFSQAVEQQILYYLHKTAVDGTFIIVLSIHKSFLASPSTQSQVVRSPANLLEKL